ncbi:MAG TPA: hypothetical protein VGR22_06790, partial [Thermomicrobiales bacterium]|nr:hypothetical protein [Thermomicrobiales bacterium]
MSDPLAGFHGETKVINSDPDPVIATKYALPEPPILVKVFVPRRSATGGRYVLAVERSSCSGIEDTCALRPAYEIPSGAPTDKPLNEADTAWFSLHPDVLTSGGTQRMGFDVITNDPGTFRMELLDKTGTVLDDALRLDGAAPLHMDVDRHRGGEPLLLTVKRWGPVNGKFPSFAVRWTTNLKRLYGTMSYNLALGANDEVGPDWSGDDEITITGLWDFRHEVKIDRYQDVDTNDQLPVPEFGTVTYADAFSVKLTESSPGEAAGLSAQKTIPDLGPLEPHTQNLGELITLTAPFGDGLYTFKYRITHEDPYKQSTAMSQASVARVRAAQSPASATPSPIAPVAQNLGATQIAFSTMKRPSGSGALASGSFDLGRMSGSPVAEELAMVATPLDDAGPALSPNGNDVVFAARGRGASRLLISSVTGAGRTRALTRGDAVDGSPAWSPDGRAIVFRREDARGYGDLFVVKSTGGRARRITRTAADESSPSRAPNGHSIVFARLGQRRRTSTLHIFDFRTRSTRPLLAGRSSKSQPDWSPDGKTIAFTIGDAGGE